MNFASPYIKGGKSLIVEDSFQMNVLGYCEGQPVLQHPNYDEKNDEDDSALLFPSNVSKVENDDSTEDDNSGQEFLAKPVEDEPDNSDVVFQEIPPPNMTEAPTLPPNINPLVQATNLGHKMPVVELKRPNILRKRPNVAQKKQAVVAPFFQNVLTPSGPNATLHNTQNNKNLCVSMPILTTSGNRVWHKGYLIPIKLNSSTTPIAPKRRPSTAAAAPTSSKPPILLMPLCKSPVANLSKCHDVNVTKYEPTSDVEVFLNVYQIEMKTNRDKASLPNVIPTQNALPIQQPQTSGSSMDTTPSNNQNLMSQKQTSSKPSSANNAKAYINTLCNQLIYVHRNSRRKQNLKDRYERSPSCDGTKINVPPHSNERANIPFTNILSSNQNSTDYKELEHGTRTSDVHLKNVTSEKQTLNSDNKLEIINNTSDASQIIKGTIPEVATHKNLWWLKTNPQNPFIGVDNTLNTTNPKTPVGNGAFIGFEELKAPSIPSYQIMEQNREVCTTRSKALDENIKDTTIENRSKMKNKEPPVSNYEFNEKIMTSAFINRSESPRIPPPTSARVTIIDDETPITNFSRNYLYDKINEAACVKRSTTAKERLSTCAAPICEREIHMARSTTPTGEKEFNDEDVIFIGSPNSNYSSTSQDGLSELEMTEAIELNNEILFNGQPLNVSSTKVSSNEPEKQINKSVNSTAFNYTKKMLNNPRNDQAQQTFEENINKSSVSLNNEETSTCPELTKANTNEPRNQAPAGSDNVSTHNYVKRTLNEDLEIFVQSNAQEQQTFVEKINESSVSLDNEETTTCPELTKANTNEPGKQTPAGSGNVSTRNYVKRMLNEDLEMFVQSNDQEQQTCQENTNKSLTSLVKTSLEITKENNNQVMPSKTQHASSSYIEAFMENKSMESLQNRSKSTHFNDYPSPPSKNSTSLKGTDQIFSTPFRDSCSSEDKAARASSRRKKRLKPRCIFSPRKTYRKSSLSPKKYDIPLKQCSVMINNDDEDQKRLQRLIKTSMCCDVEETKDSSSSDSDDSRSIMLTTSQTHNKTDEEKESYSISNTKELDVNLENKKGDDSESDEENFPTKVITLDIDKSQDTEMAADTTEIEKEESRKKILESIIGEDRATQGLNVFVHKTSPKDATKGPVGKLVKLILKKPPQGLPMFVLDKTTLKSPVSDSAKSPSLVLNTTVVKVLPTNNAALNTINVANAVNIPVPDLPEPTSHDDPAKPIKRKIIVARRTSNAKFEICTKVSEPSPKIHPVPHVKNLSSPSTVVKPALPSNTTLATTETTNIKKKAKTTVTNMPKETAKPTQSSPVKSLEAASTQTKVKTYRTISTQTIVKELADSATQVEATQVEITTQTDNVEIEYIDLPSVVNVPPETIISIKSDTDPGVRDAPPSAEPPSDVVVNKDVKPNGLQDIILEDFDSISFDLLQRSNLQCVLVNNDTNFGTGPKMTPVMRTEPETNQSLNDMLDIGSADYLNVPSSDYSITPFDQYGLGTSAFNNVRTPHVQCFIDRFKKCCIFNARGNLPIHEAVLDDNVMEIQRQCVVLKLNNKSVDIPNEQHLTALQLAVMGDCNPLIATSLLNYGADMSVLDSDGNNLLHLAITEGAEKFLEKMLDSYMMGNRSEGSDLLNAHNYEGYTPLILCCFETTKVYMAEKLLDFRADPNKPDNKSGRTPLFHAAENNNLQMVQLLLDFKADKSIKNFVGISTHDAIFELDNIDECIKSLILGREPPLVRGKVVQVPKKRQSKYSRERLANEKKRLKTVSTLQKIDMNQPGPSSRP